LDRVVGNARLVERLMGKDTFLTGEIWGLNKTLVVPDGENPQRTFQAPWPALAEVIEAAPRNYLQFAEEALNLEPPVIVIAGLMGLRDAVLVRQSTKWFTNPPRQRRFLVDSVRCHWTIEDLGVDPAGLLTSWYDAIWNECGLDYAKESPRHSEVE
jgi:hypothetical protein